MNTSCQNSSKHVSSSPFLLLLQIIFCISKSFADDHQNDFESRFKVGNHSGAYFQFQTLPENSRFDLFSLERDSIQSRRRIRRRISSAWMSFNLKNNEIATKGEYVKGELRYPLYHRKMLCSVHSLTVTSNIVFCVNHHFEDVIF